MVNIIQTEKQILDSITPNNFCNITYLAGTNADSNIEGRRRFIRKNGKRWKAVDIHNEYQRSFDSIRGFKEYYTSPPKWNEISFINNEIIHELW